MDVKLKINKSSYFPVVAYIAESLKVSRKRLRGDTRNAQAGICKYTISTRENKNKKLLTAENLFVFDDFQNFRQYAIV